MLTKSNDMFLQHMLLSSLICICVCVCQVVYIDKYQPNYDKDRNAPTDSFAVWCPLAYALLGAEPTDKESWILSIEEARDVRRVCP